ncbi:unnamed protein product [Heterobilharzia americana]|nr:unnamed protein product [Heterobilharzia americana]
MDENSAIIQFLYRAVINDRCAEKITTFVGFNRLSVNRVSQLKLNKIDTSVSSQANERLHDISFVSLPVFLSNPGSHWCMFQARRLYRRSEEVKKYFTETGDYNPPNQDVIDRFKRLRWGAYIHARAGRDKHLYRRSAAEVSRRSEHILTSRATSFLLDNMLNKQWQKPKYYPNDI